VQSSYSSELAPAFTQAGCWVLERILQAMEQSNVHQGLPDVHSLASKAAALWPELVGPDDVPGGALVTYEQSCQIDAQSALESGGLTGLRQVLGPQELVYRRLALALV
jgi:hypothetical protein